MPLIIMTGLPSSGKTTRSLELKKYFEETRRKPVHVVCEREAIAKSGYTKNELFADAQKEKQVRGDLKSEAMRLLNKENVVILDAGNYIKGYRYELYCASKAARVPQCTVWTAIPAEAAWEFNTKRSDDGNDNGDHETPYTREVFDELCYRYEAPNSSHRWDSPLYSAFPTDELDLEGIYGSLFEKAPPPPNLSTQNAPLSAPDYLHEIDRMTQDIVGRVMEAQKLGNSGSIRIPTMNSGNSSNADKQATVFVTVDCPSGVTISQLTRIRRQFINYSKSHTASSSIEMIPQLFAQYLNTNFN